MLSAISRIGPELLRACIFSTGEITVPRKEVLNNPNPMRDATQTAVIDRDVVRRCAKIGCTRKEIAAVLGIDPDTLYLHERRDPSITAIIEKGIEEGRASLRMWQRKAAHRGQNAMLIWLGKQDLGQTEKVDPRTLAVGTEDIDLSLLTDEEFNQYRALQEKASRKQRHHDIRAKHNSDYALNLSLPATSTTVTTNAKADTNDEK